MAKFLYRLLRFLRLESLSRLFREFFIYKGALCLIFFLGIMIAAIQPAGVKLTQQVIDELRSGFFEGSIKTVSLLLVLLFAVSGIAKYSHNTLRRYVSENILIKIRTALFGRYLSLPVSFLDRQRSGELLSKMQNDLVQIGAGMETVYDIMREPFTFLGLLGMAFYCDWQLASLTLLVAPLVFFLFSVSGSAVKRYSQRNLAQFSDLISVGQEALAGSRIVKVFRLESILIDKFKSIHERYFKTIWKSIRVQELSTPLVEFIGAVLIACVIFYGGNRVTQGALTAGELIAFLLAIGLSQMPIKKLNLSYLRLKVAQAAVERVYGLLDAENLSEWYLDSKRKGKTVRGVNDSICFDQVFLSYDDKVALSGISFTVSKGEVVAFVGQSGSGKSSIVNLLPRLYDVSGGAIRIDGVDIRDMDINCLRDQISYVTQETFLFNDSIYENIRYGKYLADKREIDSAAEQAHCMEFIRKCPQGFDTIIGDRGVCLSGGERQRIAIARAILKRAPILVLDEATSSLDSHSEKLVQEAMERLMEGKTTFLIAHRFSSILGADRIFVVEGGKIRESGTHEELVSFGGIYKVLLQRQSLLPLNS